MQVFPSAADPFSHMLEQTLSLDLKAKNMLAFVRMENMQAISTFPQWHKGIVQHFSLQPTENMHNGLEKPHAILSACCEQRAQQLLENTKNWNAKMLQNGENSKTKVTKPDS